MKLSIFYSVHFYGLALLVCSCSDGPSTEFPLDSDYEGDQPGECDDGADNDRDGFFDCSDEGCISSPDCVVTDADIDTDTDTDTDTDADTDTDVDTDADIDVDADTDTDTDADTGTDADTDTDTDLDVDSDADTDTDVDSGTNADADADIDADADTDADTDAPCFNVTECIGDDGCCPDTCDAGSDNDCAEPCLNVTECLHADGCCPDTCDASADFDCGTIIDAASGSPADINAALAIANPGDTVQIPAGIFSFDEQVSVNAGVFIRGAGRDETILQKSGDSTDPFFQVDCSNGFPIWFAQMKLTGDQTANSDLMDKGILLRHGCQNFRLTEIELESFGEYAVTVYGYANGVIDNCRFINIYRPELGGFGYGVSVLGAEPDEGDEAWNRPFILGDENAVFVEDSYFIGNSHAIASNNGSRYVFRYNLIEDNASELQAIDAHGPGFGWSRGSRSYEIYENTVDNVNTTCWTAIFIRGGDGVVYNNTIVQGISHPPNTIALRNESPGLDEITELHIWENYYQGSLINEVYNESPTTLEEGQDYFINEPRPGYTAYTYPHPLRGL